MSNLMEKVAERIYIATTLYGKVRGNEDHLKAVFGSERRSGYEKQGSYARDAATAAIAVVLDALQEPSEGMVEAADGVEVMGADLHDFTVYSCAGPVWQAMLAKFREEQGL